MIYIPQFYQGQIFSIPVEVAKSKSLPGINIHGISFKDSHEHGEKIAKALVYHSWKLPIRKYTVLMQGNLGCFPQLTLCDLGIVFSLLHSSSQLQVPDDRPISFCGTINLAGQIEPISYLFPYLQFLKNESIQVLVANFNKVFLLSQKDEPCLIKVCPDVYLIHLCDINPQNVLRVLALIKSLADTKVIGDDNLSVEFIKGRSVTNEIPGGNGLKEAILMGQPILSFYHNLEDLYRQKNAFSNYLLKLMCAKNSSEQISFKAESMFCAFDGAINSLNFKQIIQNIPYYISQASDFHFYLQFTNLMLDELGYFKKLQILRKNYQSAVHLLMPICPNCIPRGGRCTCTMYQRHQYQKFLGKLRPYFAIEVSDLNDLEVS